MDVYSLEDEDVNSLFITQEPRNDDNFGLNLQRPSVERSCAPNLAHDENSIVAEYLDISDEDFNILSSQVQNNVKDARYMLVVN